MRVLDRSRNIIFRVCQFMTGISMLLLAITLVICTVNVILRKFFSLPIIWADEIITMFLVGIVFMVLPMVEFRGEHLRVSLLERFVSPKTQHVLGWIQWFLTLVVTVALTLIGWKVVYNNYHYGIIAPAGKVPQYLPYIFIPIGAAITGLARLVVGPSFMEMPAIVSKASSKKDRTPGKEDAAC